MLALASCASDAPAPGGADGEDGGMVSLVLRVGISSTPGMEGDSDAPTRAGEYPAGYPYEFEDAATVYEGIHTLRVIIVSPDNRVEHNEVWGFGDKIPKGDDLYGDMIFKVKGNERKRVYLLANEASVTPRPDFAAYLPGTELLPSTAAGWMIYNDWNPYPQAYIDNEGSEEKRYVPMSEFFDIDVQKATDPATTQSEVLFITRSVVKFSFYLMKDEKKKLPESFRITKLTFDKVMQKSYLFPNNTTYLPAKQPLTSDFQRIVTNFSTPGFTDNKVLPITFTPSNFGLNDDRSGTTYEDSYSPQLYYCETQNNTAGNTFSVSCEVSWPDGEITKFDPVDLNNLPSFPRNTHVKVYIKMDDRDPTIRVDVVPYISVDLRPEFGFGDIIRGERYPNPTKASTSSRESSPGQKRPLNKTQLS